jgi:hypothetical protein
MTDALTTTSTLKIVALPAVLSVDLFNLNAQTLYENVLASYNTSTHTVLGIDIPIVGVDCLIYKTVDPTFDIKESLIRLFDYLSKLILKPIWEVLEALAKAIGAVVGDILKLPVLDLTIPDLFKDDIWQVIEDKVRKLWNEAQEELIEILKILGIPWPFFDQIEDPELSIRKIAKDIAANLLQFIFKAIDKIVKAIQTALRIFDLSTYQKPVWSEIWQKAVDAVLGEVLKYLVQPITLEELYKALVDFAKEVLKLPVVAFQDLMSVIEKFKLPVFGFPLDYKLPLNIKVEFPEKDFSKIISDMIVWLNNFLVGILRKFIEAVMSVLEFFGLPVKFLTTVKIPITLCAVENPVTPS